MPITKRDRVEYFEGLQCHVISFSIDSPDFSVEKIEPLFRYLRSSVIIWNTVGC